MVCGLRRDDSARELFINNGITTVCLNRKKIDPLVLFDIYRIVKEWKPTLLHLHGYASWNFGRIIGKIMGTFLVIQEHFIDERIPKYQQVIDWFLSGIHDKAIAVSDAVKEFMIIKRHVKGDIEIIWNGVPIDSYRKPDSQDLQGLKQKYGLSPDIKIVGIVGRLGKGKGLEYFLQAANIVVEQYKEVVFFVVGEGPLEEDLKKQTENLGLNDKVIFTGYQTEALKYLALFDVSVIASVSEGFPGVGIESFLSETPLVCTDLPGIRGVYEHDKNVLLAPPRDPHAIAEGVIRILTHPDLARKLAKNGLSVAGLCSINKIAKRYTNSYESIIERKQIAGSFVDNVSEENKY
jgi:glycosyltransferase involved in cell wall biosynthesis